MKQAKVTPRDRFFVLGPNGRVQRQIMKGEVVTVDLTSAYYLRAVRSGDLVVVAEKEPV